MNKDMLEKVVRKNDTVVYVGVNQNGKIITKVGVVKDTNAKGFLVDTADGQINVKNIIKLSSPKRVAKKVQKVEKVVETPVKKSIFQRIFGK